VILIACAVAGGRSFACSDGSGPDGRESRVANDSGLGHMSGALGTPTILLFGPTPDRTLGALPPNVQILRAGLPCEPCWLSHRFKGCGGRVDCLGALSVEMVAAAVKRVYPDFGCM
jgi:ADP-heptose:LPS heptosyltransferase